MTLYVIIADGTFDQVVETKADAERERRDLKAMGCKVQVKPVETWDEVWELETKY